MKSINKRLVSTRYIFIITLIVIVLTIVSTWIGGLEQHRTLFENSIISISVLALAFFLFLSTGLYNGIKLKDNIGKIKVEYKRNSVDMPEIPLDSIGLVDESIGGVVIGILLWILVAIALFVFIWFFGAILWVLILAFMAMLYWIFFRALRAVFKKSPICQGNLGKSLLWALYYSIIYISWVYGVVFFVKYV